VEKNERHEQFFDRRIKLKIKNINNMKNEIKVWGQIKKKKKKKKKNKQT